jgi:PAS domain S-box-containing protein
VDPPKRSIDDTVALLSAIVDSSDDAIISKNLDGTITSWNRAAEVIFGYSAAEAIGRNVTLIVPPELRAEEAMVLDQLRLGQKVDHFETIRQTKDGRRLNISLTISPLKDADGRVIGASKTARDITERVIHEREREQQIKLLKAETEARARAQAVLAEALKARDEFIAVAAHELRNPLNVFVLTLQLMHRVSSETVGPSRIQGLIEKSRVQLGRLTTLVDRLLDVTRLRTGTFELYRETFDLGGLVREVANRFPSEPAAVPISLDLAPAIEGSWDRTRIDQALTNLISNAIKYGGQKPVSVHACLEGHRAVVSVRDHGIGIAIEDLKRIFDRFERVTTKSGQEGLGLGLWITRQIIEAHGGQISASSEPGAGSVFTVSLPLQPG